MRRPLFHNAIGTAQGAQQRRASSGEGGDWARYASALQGGVVLVTNPDVFLNNPPEELARRFFLPSDLSLEVGWICVRACVRACRGMPLQTAGWLAGFAWRAI